MDILNLAIIGEAGVGKSSLLGRYTEDRYQTFATGVGVDFMSMTYDKCQIRFYDIAGENRYHNNMGTTLQNIKSIGIAYDLSVPNPLQNLQHYLDIAKQRQVIFIGLKSDIRVTSDEAVEKQILELYKIYPAHIFSVSSLTGDGCNQLLDAWYNMAKDYKVKKQQPPSEIKKQKWWHLCCCNSGE